ncbi:MAG: glycosyltransferase family 39 protein [Nitrospirae bacterium]|nr:glycosyltransferase family 39 protein [Nitrospirota bacterium]
MLAGIILTFLVTRLATLGYFLGTFASSVDEFMSQEPALRILTEGRTIPSDYLHTPFESRLYAAYLAILHRIGLLPDPLSFEPHYYLASRCISAAAGVAAIFLCYRLGALVGGASAGLLAAFFVATAPLHFLLSGTAVPHTVLLCLVTSSFLLAHRVSKAPTVRRDLLAGVLTGLASALRYDPLTLVPIASAYLFPRKHLPLWRILGGIGLILCLALLLFVALNPSVLTQRSGFWEPDRNYIVLRWQHLFNNGISTDHLWPTLQAHFAFGIPHSLGLTTVLLPVIGLLKLARIRSPWFWIFTLYAVTYGVFLILFAWHPYLSPYLHFLPVLSVGAAMAFQTTTPRNPGHTLARARFVAILLCLIYGVMNVGSMHSQFTRYEQAASWAKAHSSEDRPWVIYLPFPVRKDMVGIRSPRPDDVEALFTLPPDRYVISPQLAALMTQRMYPERTPHIVEATRRILSNQDPCYHVVERWTPHSPLEPLMRRMAGPYADPSAYAVEKTPGCTGSFTFRP